MVYATLINFQDPLRAITLKPCGRRFNHAMSQEVVAIPILICIFIKCCQRETFAQMKHCTLFIEARIFMR